MKQQRNDLPLVTSYSVLLVVLTNYKHYQPFRAHHVYHIIIHLINKLATANTHKTTGVGFYLILFVNDILSKTIRICSS